MTHLIGILVLLVVRPEVATWGGLGPAAGYGRPVRRDRRRGEMGKLCYDAKYEGVREETETAAVAMMKGTRRECFRAKRCVIKNHVVTIRQNYT